MTILILFLAGIITMCYCIPKYIFAIILKKDIPNADLTTQTKKCTDFNMTFNQCNKGGALEAIKGIFTS